MKLQVVTIYDAGVTPAIQMGISPLDYHCQVVDTAGIETEIVPAESSGRYYWRRDGRNLALLDTDIVHARIMDLEPRGGRTVPHQVVLCIPDPNAIVENRWRGHVQHITLPSSRSVYSSELPLAFHPAKALLGCLAR